MALKNDSKVQRPLYVKDSSKIYELGKDEDKMRKILSDLSTRKNSQ